MQTSTDEPTLNPNLQDFWTAPARNRVLYGGRMSSKSWDAAGVAVALAQELSIRVMCTRQFQNRIDESVYTLLKMQIERFGLLKRFAIYKTKIECPETGSEFFFYGRARNVAEIKGTDAVDIHWAEECELMTLEEWRVINPTLRNEASQHWLIFNPQFMTDFVYKRFVLNPPEDTVVRKINHNENPFLSSTARKLIEDAKKEDYDEYLHVYEGEPLTDDDTVLIKRSWILASVDAHVKLGFSESGRRMIGFDIADDGSDKCANVSVCGSIVGWSDMWKAREDELLISCTRTWIKARELGASVTYDSIGVGASAGAKFSELNAEIEVGRVHYSKFNAGGAVYKPDSLYSSMPPIKNKDHFLNIKAQAWGLLADRFRNTFNAVRDGQTFDESKMISLDASMPNLKALIDELSVPKREFVGGKIKVESKEDLKKRKVPSPNLADALIMCFAPGAEPMIINADAVRKMGGQPRQATQDGQQGRIMTSSGVEAFKNMGRTR